MTHVLLGVNRKSGRRSLDTILREPDGFERIDSAAVRCAARADRCDPRGGAAGRRLAAAFVAAIAEAAGEARIYEAAGFHGLSIENTHDRPYLKGTVGPETAAAVAVIGAEVRRAVALPLGVQVLAGANDCAMAVAHASGASPVGGVRLCARGG